MNARRAIHILLVEDNPGDARLVVEAFREAEVQSCLQWVNNVDAAFTKLRSGAHGGRVGADMIVLDLKLPRKDGRQFLGDLRSHSEFGAIRVVVLSTSAIEEDRRWVARFNNTSFHTKPMAWSAWVNWARQVAEGCALPPEPVGEPRIAEPHRLVG
ncbi:MAG: response regulator [Verrucomicrobia bacterium]|nr:response regulator [Verrucomicrobiota bacterium]MBI3869630.1 response regulator [Verrucomicrobiota bacterium]